MTGGSRPAAICAAAAAARFWAAYGEPPEAGWPVKAMTTGYRPALLVSRPSPADGLNPAASPDPAG